MRPIAVAALAYLTVTSAPAVAQPASADTAGARAAFARGKTAVQARRVDEAVSQLERAVALDRENWEYHMWLGHAYSRQISTVNFMRKALVGRRIGAEYNKAVELAPDNIDAAEARLDFFLNAPGLVGGGLDKAQAEARRITTLSAYRGRFAEARIAEHEKHPEQADSAYRALMREYSDSSGPVVALSMLYQSTGRYGEAVSVLDARLARFPDDTSSLYQLGRVAGASGQELDRGEATLRRFLELISPADSLRQANGHYRIGVIQERRGNMSAARLEYQRAVALNSGHELASGALKKLDKR